MNNKIEKIKIFNQILLAIAGVIAIIFLLITSIFFAIEMWPRSYTEEGMIATEEAELLNEEGLRKEIISFNNFQVVDSTHEIFLLPVTQASLDSPESSDQKLGLLNSYNGKHWKELIFNNFVVYYGEEDKSIVVFKDRLSIGDYMIHKNEENHLLIVSGCNKDTNKDNFLNTKDLQVLHSFNFKNKEFKEIKTPANYTTLKTYQPTKTKMILCKFGVDRNQNGTFESKLEPTVFMKLNLTNFELEPLVENENVLLLQQILEGKND